MRSSRISAEEYIRHKLLPTRKGWSQTFGTADQLFLLRVHRDDRIACTQERLDAGVDATADESIDDGIF